MVNEDVTPIPFPAKSLCKSSIPPTGRPANPTITSPSTSPARWAGLSGSTETTKMPLSTGRLRPRTMRRGRGTFCPATPIKPREIFPSLIKRPATNLAVLMAMAKQIP